MSKININDITTQYGFKDAINARLQQIEDEFNNKVFYRNNPTGEPNSLNNDIDMGNNDILNINKITVNDIGVVGESSFKELIEEAKQAVIDCTEQTTLSTLQANASAYSAGQSASSATSAADQVVLATEQAVRAESAANNIGVFSAFGTLAANTSVITLPWTYDTTRKNIAVFLSGVLQRPDNWTATNSTTVTLNFSLTEDVEYYVSSVTLVGESVLTALANTAVDAKNQAVAISSSNIGSIQSILASDSYTPFGMVACNGIEFTRSQFPDLYDTYLVGGKLLTTTYTAYAAQVALTGNCGMFALDTVNQKFKVPLLKDGDSITQASSAAELGKSVKAGLPNLTGEFPYNNSLQRGSGALYQKTAQVAQAYGIGASSGSMSYAVGFDASRSSSIYGNSTTVTDEQVRLRHFVVVASAQNNASVFDWSNYMAALAGKANVDLGNVTNNAIGFYFFAKDVKAQGVAGGSSAANTWQTRDINTITVNRIGATLANNQVTVPAGTYKIRARVPGSVVNIFRVAIYNATAGTYLEFSGSQRADTSYADNIYAEVEGEFTFTVPTKIELRFWSSISYATTGFGYASNTPGVSESYSEITIWKM